MVLPGARLLAEMLFQADKVTADRGLCQPGCIDGYRGRTSPPPRHTPHNLCHHPRHIVFLQPCQETIERGVIGHRVQLQGGSQLGVLAQPHISFAKGPVFDAHQAQHCQQLRLGKLTFAELGALSGQHRLADLQRQPCGSYQSNLCHNPPRRLQSSFSLTRFWPTPTVPYRG